MSDYEKTLDIIFGRWKSQILYAGVKLGIFDCVTSVPKNATYISNELKLGFALTYRLLRALASLGLLRQVLNHDFSQEHLLSNLLSKYPHLKGSILELESVTKNKDLLWTSKMGVDDRCTYVIGDMFNEVPSADAYIMKMILHDWSDNECVKILSNIYRSSPNEGKVFIVEHLIPIPEIPHFSKFFDIHMMCIASGRERTLEEYATLLERADWKHANTFHPRSGLMGVIEGKK
jgi:O-methyltransferase domain/Dimerisation domain